MKFPLSFLLFLALAGSSVLKAQSGCGSKSISGEIVLPYQSESGTATLYGYSEFTSPTVPPKKYLKNTVSGTINLQEFTQSNCTCGGNPSEYQSVSDADGTDQGNSAGAASTYHYSGKMSLTGFNQSTGYWIYTVDYVSVTKTDGYPTSSHGAKGADISWRGANKLAGQTMDAFPCAAGTCVIRVGDTLPVGIGASEIYLQAPAACTGGFEDIWQISGLYDPEAAAASPGSYSPPTTDDSQRIQLPPGCFPGSGTPISGGPFTLTPTESIYGGATFFEFQNSSYNQTTKEWDGKGCPTGTNSNSKYQKTEGTLTQKLSLEFTEDDAVALATKSSGTSQWAFRETRGAGDFDFSFRDVIATAKFATCPGRYLITYHHAKRLRGTTTIQPIDQKLYDVVDFTEDEQIVSHKVWVPKQGDDYEYTITHVTARSLSCSSSGGSGSAGGSASVGGIGGGGSAGGFSGGGFAGGASGGPAGSLTSDVTLMLGPIDSLRSAGVLLLNQPNIDAAIYTPAVLEYVGPSHTDVDVVRNSAGTLLQVKAPTVLARIVPLTSPAEGFDVEFYRDTDVGTKNSSTGLYALLDDPFVTHRFENPDAGGSPSVPKLLVTETRVTTAGTLTKSFEFAQDDANDLRSFSEGDGLRVIEEVTSEDENEDTVKTRTIKTSADEIASIVATTTHIYPWGEEKIKEVIDPEGAALETTWEYYDNAVTDGSNYSHLKLRVAPSGYWERYTYHPDGRAASIAVPHLNADTSAVDSSCHVTMISIEPLDDADGDLVDEPMTTTTETILGVEVSRRYEIKWTAPVTLGSVDYRHITTSQSVAPGADWDAAGSLRTEIFRHASGDFAGRLHREIRPDGTATLVTYALDGGSGELTTTTRVGEPNSTFDAIVAGRRTVTITNAHGHTVSEEVYRIASPSDVLIASSVGSGFDFAGRPDTIEYLDGTEETRAYACCGLSEVVDRFGVKTLIQYDDLGRRQYEWRYADPVSGQPPEVRTEYQYDAADRLLEKLVGPSSAQKTEVENSYDPAGRLQWTKDGLGRKTLREESKDGAYTVITTTHPDGNTEPSGCTTVEKYHRDGSLYESSQTVSPTLTRGTRHAYAIDPTSHARTVTSTPLDDDTLVSLEAVVVWRDFAGRAWKTVSPDPDGSGSVTTENVYNAAGQLWKTIRPGQPAWLREYDSLGRISAEGADVNASTTLTKGASGAVDRVTEYAYSFDTATFGASSEDCEVTTITRWVGATTSITTVDYRRLDGLGTRHEENGVLSWDYTEIGTDSVLTHHQKQPDGATTTFVTKNGRLYSETRAGATLTHEYDDYGRLTASTHGVNGVTSYAYDDAGRLKSVTSPDPDTGSSATGEGLRPQTFVHVYTDLGSSAGYGRREVVTRYHSWNGSSGTEVEKTVLEYYPTGELRLAYGPGQNPTRYVYDHASRMKTLTTWRSFDLVTGTGTGAGDLTTWNYNAAGMLSSKRYADSTGPDYTYDNAARLKTRTWARLRPAGDARLLTTYTYDSGSGDLTGISYSDNTTSVALSGHDRLGRPGTITDGAGTRTVSYAHALLDDETYSSGGGSLLAGLALTREVDTDATGYIGNPNRPGSVSATGLPAAFIYRYDSEARLGSVTQTVSSVAKAATFAYKSGVGTLETVTTTVGGTERAKLSRTIDKLGRVTRIDTTTGSTLHARRDYLHDDANRRTRAIHEDTRRWAYGYDTLGQVNSAEKRLADDTTVLPGYDFGFVFDEMGNRETATVNGRSATYASDALNRYLERGTPLAVDVRGTAATTASVLVNEELAVRTGEDFYRELPVFGQKENAIKIQAVDASANQMQTEDRVALVPAVPESFTYDLDGNLLQDGLWTYEWDAENRLIAQQLRTAVSTATWKRLEYAYDHQGRRIQKVVKTLTTVGGTWTTASDTRFLYDGWNLLAEYSYASSTFTLLRSHVWGVDLSGTPQGAGGIGGLLWSTVAASSETYAPGYDANGNIIAYIDLSDGTVAGRRDYGPFGEAAMATGVAQILPFGFSTKHEEKRVGYIITASDTTTQAPDAGSAEIPLGKKGALICMEWLIITQLTS